MLSTGHDQDYHDNRILILNTTTLFLKTKLLLNTRLCKLYALSGRVNTNGAISFGITISQYTPSRFPLGDGRAIIAPFWADVDIRKTGTVSYGPKTAIEYLKRASKDVQDSFVGFNKFSASWIFVSTWEEVPFYGSSFQEKTSDQ